MAAQCPRDRQAQADSLAAVLIRYDHARRAVAGLARCSPPTLAPLWRQVDRALADVPTLSALLMRLAAEFASASMQPAAQATAVRAAVAASAGAGASCCLACARHCGCGSPPEAAEGTT